MLLTWLWLLPAVGALATWALPASENSQGGSSAARWAARLISIGILAYSLWLLIPYSSQSGALRLQESGAAAPFGIRYEVGVDGVGLCLCWLTAFLTVLALCSSGMRRELPSSYWAAFLGLESALLGVFTAQNLFYFYIFWDLALIPMFFIIGVWGSERRLFAAIKFILYTFVGSIALLVGIIALAVGHFHATGVWTWNVAELARTSVRSGAARWIFAAMALGFAVKIPVFPLHNWLPDVHTEAPAAGSVMLAGSMLKMGVYGFLHVLLPIFPEMSRTALPVFGVLGAINVLYGALCAMAQTDLKRLVAYTSISHLGFCMLGLFSLTAEGLAGGSLQMINHGLSTGGLFLLVGMLYDRAHRRGVSDFGDLAKLAPWFSFFFGFVLLSSIGLPGLNGFVGEFMSLAGMAKASPALALLGLGGGILAAAYGLPTYQRIFWAPQGEDSVSSKISDMEVGEQLMLWSLAALILWIGLYPAPLLHFMEPSIIPLAVR